MDDGVSAIRNDTPSSSSSTPTTIRNRCSGTRASSLSPKSVPMITPIVASASVGHMRASSAVFDREVHRNTRHIDQQRHRGRRRDELPLVDLESEHGGGSNAALIADEAAKKSGERSAKPCERAAKPPAFRVAGHLRRTGEHEQRSEDELEHTACRPRVEQRAGQAACGAREAEALYDRPVDLMAKPPEANRCADRVGDGYCGNGKLGARRGRDGWRQHAADAESGDRRDRAAKKLTKHEELKHGEDIREDHSSVFREHARRAALVERTTSYACAFVPGYSMPGEPTGMPPTAIPTIAGFSFNILWTSAAGTCPSTT